MLVETPSLLISDDDRALRETLAEVFRRRGFLTRLAGDGEEAISIVRTETIHLVLVDLQMPRLTGLEVVRQVRRDRRPLPCILISAAWDNNLRRQAQEADVFSMLEKPVSFAEVTETVGRAMRAAYDWPPHN